MNTSKDNPVLLNLQDSVSRIVDNLGFTSIDSTAHAKLVSIMAETLHSMSHTCRILAENAGRAPFSLTTVVDVKHLFRIHRIDLEGLGEYVRQVRPFPPRSFEIHGSNAKPIGGMKTQVKKKRESLNPGVPMMKQPKRPVSSIPIFDDMDVFELGFSEPEPSTSPVPVQLPPPPPPPPLPPLPSPDDTFEIPIFDPEVPPPPINVFPPQNYTSPDFVAKREEPITLKIVQNGQLKEERNEATKPSKTLKNENSKTNPSEKTPSLVGPKKTRKRQMQSNYERRLRDEHLAEEEKQKERRERKRMRAEMAVRRSAEREAEKEKKMEENRPSTVFKFSSALLNAYKRKEQSTDAETSTAVMDENENSKKANTATESISTSSASTSSSADDLTGQKPLPKLLIRYRQVPRGILVKRVIRTKFRWKNGQWKPMEREWKYNRGVFSQAEEPQKPFCDGRELIPKIKLIRNADGSYKVK